MPALLRERLPWQERWLAIRNGLIADPRFQRWSARIPLLRIIARRRSRALFDLCAGFVYAQILLACVRLRVFESLAAGPMRAVDLAERTDLSPEAAVRLLRAAVSLNLLRRLPGDRFALADLGAALLGNPSIAGFIEHHAMLYDDLRDPVALLRGDGETRLSRYWPYAGESPFAPARPLGEAEIASYSALMSASQTLVAQDILDAYPLDRHKILLDIGGGEGAFAAEAAARAPRLAVTLFDLPAVAERASRRLQDLGLGGRIATAGGSFLTDPLPACADVASLVRIVHDHDDESALVLLRAAHAALAPGGVLLVAEPMADTRGAEPMGDAYFGFYLLAMGRGRVRTAAELRVLLHAAGFASVTERRTSRPMMTRLLTARRM